MDRQDGKVQTPTLAGALAELSRTQLLLNLATLPDLSFEAKPNAAPDGAGAPDGETRAGSAGSAPAGENALAASLRHVAHLIRGALGVNTAGFLLLDDDRQRLIAIGAGSSVAAAPENPRPGSPAGDPAGGAVPPALRRVFDTGEPLRVHAATADRPTRHLLEALDAETLMAAPISIDDDPRGVLYVAGRRDADFSESDLAFLTLVGGRVGLLIERAELSRAQREIERQRAQAAARQELLGIVTHELKTPVAVLRAYTEVLLARAEQAGRTDEADLLRRMDDQTERLLAMVEQVLDLQRIDAGLFPLEVGRVDLAALANRVVEGLQLTAGSVRLRVEAAGDAQVRADRRRIEQVLINLVQNAIRFSPPGGEVLVRVAPAPQHGPGAGEPRPAPAASDGRVHVRVTDQGPGVSEAERERIFTRFYQGKGGDRLHRGHGGLGVGLYIAREIVDRHQGELWLEPAVPGVPGATFAFSLPVAGPDEDD